MLLACNIIMNNQIEYLKKLSELANRLTENDDEKCESLRTSAYSTLSNLFGDESIYVRQLERNMRGYAGAFIMEVRAIIKSALHDFESGALYKYESLVLIDAFEKFLSQAKELNKGGEDGKKPASVLVAAVLEDFLSRMCLLNKLNIPGSAQGKIDLLKSKLLINSIEASRFESIKELRNFSFHTKWESFTNADFDRSIKDLEDLIINLMNKNNSTS